jgi:hypothetical protein
MLSKKVLKNNFLCYIKRMIPKNLIPKVKKGIYNERAYAKAKEMKKHCEDCGCLVFKNKWAAHIESNKHKTNVEKVKVDFNSEVQRLAKELVKAITKTNLVAIYELIKHEYYDASGEEVEETIDYCKPSPITKDEIRFCDQEIGCMNMEVIEKLSNFADAGYHPTYLERLEDKHALIDASSPQAKIKLLEFYRKCQTFVEDTEKEIEKDRLKVIEEKNKELKELEKQNIEAKEALLKERQPDKKIIKEIKSNIIIPETIEEDYPKGRSQIEDLSETYDMDYTVNSNDEDCCSEDSYDIEARFYREAEEIYRNFPNKKRIDLLRKELVGCEEHDDYKKFLKEFEQTDSKGKIIPKTLDLEAIKRIYCGIKTYKYNLENCH